MNKLIKEFLDRIKVNFEENNKELKKEFPEEYKQALDKHIFRIYMFVCVTIMMFGIFITFFITEILF